MKKSFKTSAIFTVKPHVLFDAWINSQLHTEMTGGEAQCSDQINGTFSAWDGYITGSNIELISPRLIKQRWRTTEFDANDEDSVLHITFENHSDGCKLSIHHSHIPVGDAGYKQGWVDFYFTPMKAYFLK